MFKSLLNTTETQNATFIGKNANSDGSSILNQLPWKWLKFGKVRTSEFISSIIPENDLQSGAFNASTDFLDHLKIELYVASVIQPDK